jgi:hypothetical protein
MKALGPFGFSLREYTCLIRTFMNYGYKCRSLSDLRAEEAGLFLRHDVDLCPWRALKMARLEADIGVTSTYYFLVSTEFYNVADANVRSLLRDITNQGHRIGLHFDASRYCSDSELECEALNEVTLLERCINATVDSISFHRPAPEFRGRLGRFAGLRHAYEPDFFNVIGYVSDSNGAFNFGHPLDLPQVANRRAIQLLTHPIWWVGSEEEDHIAKLERFRRERMENLYHSIADNVKAYAEWRKTSRADR